MTQAHREKVRKKIDPRLSADLLLQVTALLHGDGVRLLGEYFAYFREVAVLRHCVFNLG